MGIYIEISHFFVPIRVWVFDGVFVVFNTMQEPSYLENIIRLVAVWSRMVVNQQITLVYKDSLNLTNSPNIKYLTRIVIMIPTCRYLDTIIDVD
jgi:hypothetical protein